MRAIHAILLCVAAAAAACASPDPEADRDPNRCATCHMPEYQATTDPMHPGQKPTTCGVCHAMTSWHPSRVDHPYFPLTEAHAKPQCFDCHKGTPPVFHGTPKKCDGCHHADFERATFPGHSEFPLTCEECHTTIKWKPSTWKTLPDAGAPRPEPTATPTTAPTAKPKAPRPKPKPQPTPAPSGSGPVDVITHPSRRR